jgi:cellobiose phosphorylase
VAATQWILGIRPTHDGLRVAPCLPAEWPGYRASRVLRGTRYDITVRRGGGPSVHVDGRAIDDDVVPFAPPGTPSVEVEVTVG